MTMTIEGDDGFSNIMMFWHSLAQRFKSCANAARQESDDVGCLFQQMSLLLPHRSVLCSTAPLKISLATEVLQPKTQRIQPIAAMLCEKL